MIVITVVATKGGVGKTTIAANLGGLLRDLGLRVLMIDADVQPSLSRYFRLQHDAPNGLTALVTSGFLSADCMSTVQLPFGAYKDVAKYPLLPDIKLVRSDTREGNLQDWLAPRLDRLVRLSMPLRHQNVQEQFDVVIIDTQGALGYLQDAAINAADLLVSPATPDVISAREFIDGSMKLIDRTEEAANLGLKVPPMKAVINRLENTRDSRVMSELIREDFMRLKGRVTVMRTVIPSIVAFKKAATMQVPVHWIDPERAGQVMHELLWELIPSLAGRYAPNHPNPGQQACGGTEPSPLAIQSEASSTAPPQ
ncbi:MAG: ParA family protein [Burkholderiaceae bacterium]|jgi:chromosome partitioning related protein ParA|nr:ParA family protein [Burkholderiaceae bacterium]